jgi:hypothetical protein
MELRMRVGTHPLAIAIAPGKVDRSVACNPLVATASPLRPAVAAASRLAVAQPVAAAVVPEAAEPDALREAVVAAAHARPVAVGSAAAVAVGSAAAVAVGPGVLPRAARVHGPQAAEAQLPVLAAGLAASVVASIASRPEAAVCEGLVVGGAAELRVSRLEALSVQVEAAVAVARRSWSLALKMARSGCPSSPRVPLPTAQAARVTRVAACYWRAATVVHRSRLARVARSARC